jgi:glucose/arabinose dehydrogenase
VLPRALPATAAATVVLALVLAIGCGGDDGSASTGPRHSALAAASRPGGSGDTAVHAARKRIRLKRIGSFSSPVYVTAPRGDRSRLFVVEQRGRVRVLVNGREQGQPFLDISSIVQAGGERGLLSMAFAPNYARSGRFYVYFTDHTGDIRIRQYRRSSGNANVADPGSGRNVIRIRHREFANHNGGQLQFGPDGFLYFGTGDGGSGGDPHRHGQDLSSRLGKLLRIDPKAGGGYKVPRSNPFRGRSGARPEIWAYGLRNPWRFSFDRKTGALAIGDVGQDQYEEIDFARRSGRGDNYGWNIWEGRHRFSGGRARHYHRPAVEHSHGDGWCSITGGYIVRDRSLGALYGRYVYGDLCHSQLRSVKMRGSHGRGDRALGPSVGNLVSFGEDARAHVYAVSLNGPVYRLVAR